MSLTAILSWFGRPPEVPGAQAELGATRALAESLAGSARSPAHAAALRWPEARIAAAESVWGEGFTGPGGAEEVLRLSRPLGITPAASALLLGAAGGGPSRALTTAFGGWVSGFEADPQLVALATDRLARAGLARRAPVAQWSPQAPTFRQSYFHHVLALEALRGARPELALGAVAQALKPGGQLMLTELVVDAADEFDNAMVSAWTSRDMREREMPTETHISRTLTRLGFDVRVVEDVSDRHTAAADRCLGRRRCRPSRATAGRRRGLRDHRRGRSLAAAPAADAVGQDAAPPLARDRRRMSG